jgi:hypothetical protein
MGEVLGGWSCPVPAGRGNLRETGRSDPGELQPGVGHDCQWNGSKQSNGEYEVHNIGVNWPHHIFVNQNFKVVGADEPRRPPREVLGCVRCSRVALGGRGI